MATTRRQFSLKTHAAVIGGSTLSIVLGVAVFGWFAGWQTIDQYSTALRIAGVIAGLVGVASLAGNQTNQTRGADAQFGAASLV